MINCIAIDDEPLALEVLKKYISQVPELNLMATYSDAIEATQSLQHHSVNLLFLDIQMPDINGFQLYRNLPQKPLVIFTTAYREYAVDGFEVEAIDYLLKPFNLTRFQKAVARVINRIPSKQMIETPPPLRGLYIHEDYKMVKIPFEDILYIEALDDYIRIHTTIKSHLTLLSMKKVLEKLPASQFTRVHRSYIIANEKIVFVQFRKLRLINDIELPIGDTYRSSIPDLRRYS